MTNYGYIRVSGKDINNDSGYDAFISMGIDPCNIYIDRPLEGNTDFPASRILQKKISAGDCLFVPGIDHLGSNYEEIIKLWDYVTRECRANIIVLDMPLLDTRNDANKEPEKSVAAIALQVMTYMAESARRFNQQRQREGISSAKERGVQFGRKRKEIPADFVRVYAQYRSGEISSREAGELLGVSHVTFLSWVASLKTDEKKEK